jgi:uncharacterized protein YcbK (DUF882 family)
MSSKTDETGHRQPYMKRLWKTFAAAAVAATMLAGSGILTPVSVEASGETRTISIYHTHTKERLNITYKVNGRYIPSAMKKINYILRDWRRNEVVRIDPKTIDLMWELHADLGSRAPVHIVCGYRSAKTNGFLKRIGRNVAKKSQHILGKAIDLYFPDVSSEKIRNSAMVRQVGGVGYYRRSAGPTGFVHIDSGHVRHWPRISNSQLAQIFRDGRKTVGRRLNRNDEVMMASAEDDAKLAAQAAASGEDFDEDNGPEIVETKKPGRELRAAVKVDVPAPKAKPVTIADRPEEVAEGYPVPLPRAKPIEILFMAANDMKIEPASAPPEKQVPERARPVADALGTVEAAETLVEEPQFEQASNTAAKGSFAAELLDGTAEGTPMIKTLAASASGDDIFWWPKSLTFQPDATIRRDGAPQKFELEQDQLAGLVAAASAAEAPMPLRLAAVTTASGKSDMLVVNRAGKGGLLIDEPPARAKRQKLGQLRNDETATD